MKNIARSFLIAAAVFALFGLRFTPW